MQYKCDTLSTSFDDEAECVRRIRRRDYFLVPLTSLVTLLLMFGVAEAGCRMLWPEYLNDTCLDRAPAGGFRNLPNCNVRLKNAEGPWVDYHYNECGSRSYAPCVTKPPGTIRIALIGSSFSQGLYVPFNETFGQIAADTLSRELGRPVEVQNFGVKSLWPVYCYRRISETLALHPDLIVYAVGPYDIQGRAEPNGNGVGTGQVSVPHVSPIKRMQALVNKSRAFLVGQHFLFTDLHTYFRIHVKYGDQANLFRSPISPEWRDRFDDLDGILAGMAERCRKANVPMVIMAIPSRGEAALLTREEYLPNTDPFAFGRIVGGIASRHGLSYADVLSQFSHTPRSANFFYPVDMHITPQAEVLLADALVKEAQGILDRRR